MAIYDHPNFGTLPRGPQGPQDPKSAAKLVTLGSRFGQVKKIDIEFFSCWTAEQFLQFLQFLQSLNSS